MIAARWGMLLGVALLMLASFGATATELQPSALRLTVTAVVGLLAPLFWPGIGATPLRTAQRIALWSAAAAVLAAIVLRLLGPAGQPVARIVGACTMLMFVLVVAHAAVAVLEARWRGGSADADSAREMAGRTVAFALAALGSLPLWLGPAAEGLSRRHEGLIDAVIGASPLTHLAVASGNDLLRNQWLYQHSNLAAQPFSYPGLAEIAGTYAAVGLTLALVTLALRRLRRPIADATGTHPTTEKVQ